ncbi:MAG: endonuclease/exonuclease/phosphatase family protein [Phycisphaerae bacterium]|jgi:endonuclease/exonuclease/phosphatase family metal-dependent hydrolase
MLAELTLVLAALAQPAPEASAQAAATSAVDLTVVGFNVESGGADIAVLRKQVADMQGVDLWGFSEVDSEDWARELDKGAEEGENASFDVVLGASGQRDRLAIAFNTDRFELVRKVELGDINIEGKVRAPLVIQVKDREHAGLEYLFMVNHLYRGSAEGRHKQGELLNAWIRTQTLPVIAVGDYNFDYLVDGGDKGQRDQGFDNMTKDNMWTWVRPATLDTTTAPSKRRPGAVLDFVFVGNDAAKWPASSEIVKLPDEFSDRDKTSDHRPILATFDLPGDAATQPTTTPKVDPAVRERELRQIDEQIERLREQLKELEERRRKLQ